MEETYLLGNIEKMQHQLRMEENLGEKSSTLHKMESS